MIFRLLKSPPFFKKGSVAGLSQLGVMNLRVFLVEDHLITAFGVKNALAATPHLKLVGEAREGEQALKQIPFYNPDIVLMDLSLPGIKGIEVTRILRTNGFKHPIIWFS